MDICEYVPTPMKLCSEQGSEILEEVLGVSFSLKG